MSLRRRPEPMVAPSHVIRSAALGIDNAHFTLRVRRLGGPRPFGTFITQGVGIVGESGSTTYAARTPEGSVRKAMRTVASIAAAQHLSPITIEVRAEGDRW